MESPANEAGKFISERGISAAAIMIRCIVVQDVDFLIIFVCAWCSERLQDATILAIGLVKKNATAMNVLLQPLVGGKGIAVVPIETFASEYFTTNQISRPEDGSNDRSTRFNHCIRSFIRESAFRLDPGGHWIVFGLHQVTLSSGNYCRSKASANR